METRLDLPHDHPLEEQEISLSRLWFRHLPCLSAKESPSNPHWPNAQVSATRMSLRDHSQGESASASVNTFQRKAASV